MEKEREAKPKQSHSSHSTHSWKPNCPFLPLLHPSFSMEKDTAGMEYPMRGSRLQLCPSPAQGKPNLGQTQLPNTKHNSQENLTPSLPEQNINTSRGIHGNTPKTLPHASLRGRKFLSNHTNNNKNKPGQVFWAGIPAAGPKLGISAPRILLKFHFWSSRV